MTKQQQQAAIKIQRAYKKFITRAFTRHKAAKKIQKNYRNYLNLTRRVRGFRNRVERIRRIQSHSPFFKPYKGHIYDNTLDDPLPVFPVKKKKKSKTAVQYIELD